MDIRKSNLVPKYYQIYEDLLKDIREGKFQEGDRFPSDTELVERYQVSRGTIREAVKLLLQRGFLIRQQGKGTFVTYRKIQQDPEKLIGFTELMKKHNIKPKARLIEVSTREPSRRIARLLKLEPNEKVVKIQRLRFGEDQPLIIERSFFNYELFRPLLAYDLENSSIFELLYKHTDIRLGEATQSIEAISATQSEQELLNVSVGTPLLLIKRLIKTKERKCFQYSEDVYRSDKISFTTTTYPYENYHDRHGLPLDLMEQEL